MFSCVLLTNYDFNSSFAVGSECRVHLDIKRCTGLEFIFAVGVFLQSSKAFHTSQLFLVAFFRELFRNRLTGSDTAMT